MTPRQERILECIILEFMQTAQAVGSVSVADKYNIKASPATIRNEMADLIGLGFIEKEHFSAGRIPTSVGFRYYIEHMLKEDEMGYVQEMNIKEGFHDARFQRDKLLRTAVETLSSSLKYAAVALFEDALFYSGISEILDYPEFEDISVLKNVVSVLENYNILESIFEKGVAYEQDVKVLIGEESGFNSFKNSAIVFSGFRLHRGEQGYIAVIGPYRMDYKRVFPVLRYVTDSLEEVTAGW